MNKKGDIWISAALYTAIGIILIGLVLSVGMPFINKVKMRNTLLQTKEVMYNMDNVIREVWNEGLGSRRPIFVEIQEGDFIIYDDTTSGDNKDIIVWSVISEDKLGIEPGAQKGQMVIHEGNLEIESIQLGQGYQIELRLDYKGSNIPLITTAGTKQLSGAYNLVIEQTSDCGTTADRCIKIREA